MRKKLPAAPAAQCSLERYLQDIGHHPLLTAAEEAALAVRATAGDAAAQARLVECNLRLVVAAAKRHAGQGVSVDDLISDGNMGLVKAARAYRAAPGTRFAAFALPRIHAAMQHAVAAYGATVRRPAHARPAHDLSADAPLAGSKDTCLTDKLADTTTPAPDEPAGTEAVRHFLAARMDRLGERERNVVAACYGIGQPRMTFAAIGEKYGFTRERARQIRKKALRKLGSKE